VVTSVVGRALLEAAQRDTQGLQRLKRDPSSRDAGKALEHYAYGRSIPRPEQQESTRRRQGT